MKAYRSVSFCVPNLGRYEMMVLERKLSHLSSTVNFLPLIEAYGKFQTIEHVHTHNYGVLDAVIELLSRSNVNLPL